MEKDRIRTGAISPKYVSFDDIGFEPMDVLVQVWTCDGVPLNDAPLIREEWVDGRVWKDDRDYVYVEVFDDRFPGVRVYCEYNLPKMIRLHCRIIR